ncbi:hypothetical protein E308F_17640 [Moorella sp. E308F]|uniref:hypothetical protein n=1 Tax=unclassified Neomoorella TaxID=2676739 RepID=UPI0010FFBD5A|nr:MULTISPECIES: hypothetical protein [unclassified Moorella (in: firmicutes)]GEA15520.1 hypothetical protein E308F_17640 [Moorella sp. E308F]GEA19622.1 hypothetical protein E306M_27600 [Moorella sp. E306M]
MRELVEDILVHIGSILMWIFIVILFLSVLGGLHWVDAKDKRAFEAVPVVLETKLGVEVEYSGHKIVYTGLSHSYPQYDDINLLVDGKPLTLSPRASLDEVGAGWNPRYAFFLPDGRRLILKEVSKDRSVLKWTDVDWSQNK